MRREGRLPWFLQGRTLRGTVDALMAEEGWDDGLTREEIHRDAAFSDPRHPGHVAERKRKVLPPSTSADTMRENVLVSPTLLQHSLSQLSLVAK
mmetsp:Transcript_11189/g.33191  ORF Transcript_11189/g.33191 Transcript_11189/m.33191 type:complete len:94 (-) Transcript_11189:82-363(-)